MKNNITTSFFSEADSDQAEETYVERPSLSNNVPDRGKVKVTVLSEHAQETPLLDNNKSTCALQVSP